MTDASHETRVTHWIAFGHYGLTHYRIWQKKTAHGMWQRHEWKREDGTTNMEEWIASPNLGWSVGSTPVAEAA